MAHMQQQIVLIQEVNLILLLLEQMDKDLSFLEEMVGI